MQPEPPVCIPLRPIRRRCPTPIPTSYPLRRILQIPSGGRINIRADPPLRDQLLAQRLLYCNPYTRPRPFRVSRGVVAMHRTYSMRKSRAPTASQIEVGWTLPLRQAVLAQLGRTQSLTRRAIRRTRHRPRRAQSPESSAVADSVSPCLPPPAINKPPPTESSPCATTIPGSRSKPRCANTREA